MREPIPATQIRAGQWFRKVHGEYVYLRVADDSAKSMGLDYRARVYGVCFNGNMTAVKSVTLVVPVSWAEAFRNIKDRRLFELSIGCQETSDGQTRGLANDGEAVLGAQVPGTASG